MGGSLIQPCRMSDEDPIKRVQNIVPWIVKLCLFNDNSDSK